MRMQPQSFIFSIRKNIMRLEGLRPSCHEIAGNLNIDRSVVHRIINLLQILEMQGNDHIPAVFNGCNRFTDLSSITDCCSHAQIFFIRLPMICVFL